MFGWTNPYSGNFVRGVGTIMEQADAAAYPHIISGIDGLQSQVPVGINDLRREFPAGTVAWGNGPGTATEGVNGSGCVVTPSVLYEHFEEIQALLGRVRRRDETCAGVRGMFWEDK